jgi:hypothetical protein
MNQSQSKHWTDTCCIHVDLWKDGLHQFTWIMSQRLLITTPVQPRETFPYVRLNTFKSLIESEITFCSTVRAQGYAIKHADLWDYRVVDTEATLPRTQDAMEMRSYLHRLIANNCGIKKEWNKNRGTFLFPYGPTLVPKNANQLWKWKRGRKGERERDWQEKSIQNRQHSRCTQKQTHTWSCLQTITSLLSTKKAHC